MKYLCDPHVIPAVVPQDFAAITSFASAAKEYAQWFHLDIVDGILAKEKTWPFGLGHESEYESLLKGAIRLPDGISVEAHLMTAEPQELGSALIRAGARRVLAHIEAFMTPQEAREAFVRWRTDGAEEVGLVLKIDTPLSSIADVAAECDVVQLMSIAEIGAQGKSFDERSLSRVEELHALYPDMMVAVDGGVSEATVEALVRAGANRLIVGRALAASTAPQKTYAAIHSRAMQGCYPQASAAAV